MIGELLNKRALSKLGWTPGLIAALLDKPDEVKHHKRGVCRWVEHLYARDRVDAGMRDPRFRAALEKRRLRDRRAAKRREDIPERYAGWRKALPEAVAGMFSLNRYAKHRNCSELHKVEIYRLKNQLIETLYLHGYATASWVHRLTLEARTCRECEGLGGDCHRCDGSGIYQNARTVEYWCFRFLVEGKPYCWHQPFATVEFRPVETVPPQDWAGFSSDEKPVALPKNKFAAVKELLRWVIDRAESEISVSPPVSPGENAFSAPSSDPSQDALPF